MSTKKTKYDLKVEAAEKEAVEEVIAKAVPAEPAVKRLTEADEGWTVQS